MSTDTLSFEVFVKEMAKSSRRVADQVSLPTSVDQVPSFVEWSRESVIQAVTCTLYEGADTLGVGWLVLRLAALLSDTATSSDAFSNAVKLAKVDAARRVLRDSRQFFTPEHREQLLDRMA